MTVRGWGYIGLLALTLFLAFATGVREIFWVLLFLVLLLALAAVSVLLAALSITCRLQLASSHVQRREDVSLEVTLSGFLIFPALADFGIMSPQSGENGRVRFSLKKAAMTRLSLRMGYFKETFSIETPCDHRGLWKTIPRRMRVYDAFGIFSLPLLRRGSLSGPGEPLAVYPNLHSLEMDVDAPKFTTDSSSLRVSVADYGDSYAGVRSYREGDSLKRIHWVQTARTHELQTRQYEISSEPYVLVLLDAASHCPQVDDYADIAAEAAAALAQYYVVSGQTVRLMIVGNPALPYGDLDLPVFGMDDFAEAYDQLMAAPFARLDEKLDMSEVRIDNAGQLQAAYVISDRYSDELFSLLNDMAQRRCNTNFVMPLPAGDEKALPDLEGTMVKLTAILKPEEISERLGGGLRR